MEITKTFEINIYPKRLEKNIYDKKMDTQNAKVI